MSRSDANQPRERQPREPWTPTQRKALFAGAGSWTLDAFDYFVLVFALSSLAKDFHITIVTATLAITFTLVLRPVGALVFGPLAERFGRKPILVINIVVFSLIELGSALSPNFETFFTLRVLYGIAMGGIWGVASALTMESIPTRSRGLVSGIFQAGYPLGYLIASIVYGLLINSVGWRGMFAIGVVPILLAVYIFFRVDESPVWTATRGARRGVAGNGVAGNGVAADGERKAAFWPAVAANWPILIFAVFLMAGFNFFSHGTQDLYPTFLTVQRHFSAGTVSLIAIFYNIAAIIGGLIAGSLSERFGRKRTIIVFALLALPCIPLWAFSTGSVALGIGAFLIQFMVQGAWGVIPAYLNELVPEGTRAVLPGFVYQVGNVIAAANATIQALIAQSTGGNYALAMALVAGIIAIFIAVLIAFGPETRGREFVTAGADTRAAG
ncbi:MFS transporter [Sinomonas humi]|uniref:MFS transporter n=1 Tax=Sinomonas humi TaxID=1338436 RepID=UPI00068D376C|nr:MFS transporter [Sinomonas humi]